MIPKSLHTITALVNVARHLNPLGLFDARTVTLSAAEILGYPLDTPDTYGLIERAAAILSKGKK